MDATGFFIMDKLRKNEPLDMKEIFMMVVIIPFIGKLFNTNGYFMIFIDYISKLIFEQGQKKLKSKYTIMTIHGIVATDYGFSNTFHSINREVLKQNLTENVDILHVSIGNTREDILVAKEIKEFTKLCKYNNQQIDIKLEHKLIEQQQSKDTDIRIRTYTYTLRVIKCSNSCKILDDFVKEKTNEFVVYLESKKKINIIILYF
jgi:S-adenosylmethionine hydrolase